MALQTVPGVRKAEKSTQGAYIKSSVIVTRTTTYVYDKAGNLINEADCNGNSMKREISQRWWTLNIMTRKRMMEKEKPMSMIQWAGSLMSMMRQELLFKRIPMIKTVF